MADITTLATTKTPYDSKIALGVTTPMSSGPVVQTSDLALNKSVLPAQAMMNDKTTGQLTQSQNNQALSQQTAQDQAKQQADQTKQEQTTADKQSKKLQIENELRQKQQLLYAAQGLDPLGRPMKPDSTPSANSTGNIVANSATGNAVVNGNVATSTRDQQVQLYQDDPNAFNAWVNSQGLSEAYTSGIKYDASVKQYQEAADSAKGDLAKFANGTYPLTPDQQSLLDATKNQFESLVTQQEQTNKSYENGVRILGQVTGRAEYFPDIAMGQVQSAINNGLQKVADLHSKESSALATMRIGFDQDNFKMVAQAHQMILDIDKQIETEMKDTHDAIIKAQQDARDFEQKQTEFQWKQVVDTNTMDFNDKKIALDKLQLDETTRHNAQDELIARENAMKGTYQIKDNPDGTQSIFNTKTGEIEGSPINSLQNGQFSSGIIAPGSTGVPLLDANTRQTDSGVWYVDGTNLTGKEATAVQLQAAKLGLPYLGKEGSDAQANIDTARNNMKLIDAEVSKFLPSNWFTRLEGVALYNTMAQYLQSDSAQASFGAYRSAAIQGMRAMAGSKGLRINQAEILQAVEQDIPKITDTLPTAKAKILKVNTMLDSQERGLYGNKYDVMKIEGKAPSSTDALKQIGALDPKYQKQIQSIHATYPAYTDDDILQIFNPNAK